MRKILFRGKRTDNGEWVEGFYVRLFEKKNGFYQANHYIFDGNIRLGEETYTGHGNYYQEVIICKRKIDEKTLGQFTGMTDKNGKNIFWYYRKQNRFCHNGTILQCNRLPNDNR